MAKTVRIHITLAEPHAALLQFEAERLGISISELVRRIVDAYREGKAS